MRSEFDDGEDVNMEICVLNRDEDDEEQNKYFLLQTKRQM